MNRMKLPDGYGVSPPFPWCLNTLVLQSGETSVDVRRVANSDVWSEVYRHGVTNPVGAYWNGLKQRYSKGPLSKGSEKILVHVAASSAGDGGALQRSGLIDGNPYDTLDRRMALQSCEGMVRRLGSIERGVAAVRLPYEAGARPGISILTSSPDGGGIAAHLLLMHLESLGIWYAIAESIADNQYGRVILIFLPEWYIADDAKMGEVDWAMWQKMAKYQLDRQMEDAALIWCDTVAKAMVDYSRAHSLMVDSLAFDWYDALVWVRAEEQEVETTFANLKFDEPPALLQSVRSILRG